jgi:serine/threonine protein phosphatase PrpC
MEDAHIACLDLKNDLPGVPEDRGTFLEGIAVFGVFDGHGGTYVII